MKEKIFKGTSRFITYVMSGVSLLWGTSNVRYVSIGMTLHISVFNPFQDYFPFLSHFTIKPLK